MKINSDFEIKYIDFGLQKDLESSDWRKIMVCQIEGKESDWSKVESFYHYQNLSKIKLLVIRALEIAKNELVQLLVFPELSIPIECVNHIIEWSKANRNTVIVAGTHYENIGNSQFISKCPIVYNGNCFFSEKINPARIERNPVNSLNPGQNFYVFCNSPIGNFAVLICSDNLTDTVKDKIKNLDLDFWIVPAFQKDSDWHLRRMSIDVEATRKSRYIIYCNTKVDKLSDGNSSFFGALHNDYLASLLESGKTNNKHKWRLVTLPTTADYFILDADINFKRPSIPNFPSDAPNIKNIYINKLFPEDSYPIEKVYHNATSENLREQIITETHNYIVEKYFIKNPLLRSIKDIDLFKTYGEYFSAMINNYPDVFSTEPSDVFKTLSHQIINSSAVNPLLLYGYTGCGKSTFLSLLYWYMYLELKNNESQIFPFYINLNYYNQIIYKNPNDVHSEAKTLLDRDLQLLHSLYNEYATSKLIIIIDGVEEYNDLKVDLDSYVVEKLSDIKRKSIIVGLRKSKDINFEFSKKINTFHLIENPSTVIELKNIQRVSPNFNFFLKSFSQIISPLLNIDRNDLYVNLLSTIDLFRLDSVDHYIVNILAHIAKYPLRYKEVKGLGAFYGIYLNTKGITVNKCSELAFKMYNTPNTLTVSEKNQVEWFEIFHHESLRNYLIAEYIVKKLVNLDLSNRNVFNYVYPHSINVFCKEIINSSSDNQQKAFLSIQKLLKGLKKTDGTHLLYLLGRFSEISIREKAKLLLNNIKKKNERDIEEKIPYDSTKTLNREENKLLLYYRTIYISLIYLNDTKSSTEYITILLRNKYFNSLNNGFHREYYQDIEFYPNSIEALNHSDDLGSFTNTFNILYRKLNTAINQKSIYPLFELELYTICSLAQYRLERNSLDGNTKSLIIELVEKVVSKNPDKIDRILYLYLDFILKELYTNERFLHARFAIELYKIKDTLRNGWVERNIDNPETVAAHIIGAVIIILFYLPEKIHNEPNYDKIEILKMILIHDLAEAYMGDITPTKRNDKTDKLEQNLINYLSFIGTYFDLSDSSYIRELFHDFNHSKSINSQIARDIDKLDNLLQLSIYTQDYKKKKIEDADEWKIRLVNQIHSEQGRKIMKYFLESFNESSMQHS